MKNPMVRISKLENWVRALGLLSASLLCIPADLSAQTDNISFLAEGRATMRGEIQASSPTSIEVALSSGKQTVNPWDVRSVRLADEPNYLARARANFSDQRYNAALAAIQDATDRPTRKVMIQELDFYAAMSTAHMALQGEQVSIDSAKQMISQFMSQHADSFRMIPVVSMMGDLEIASGDFAAASSQFQKLVKTSWVDFQLQAQLKLGLCQLRSGNASEAIQSFKQVQSVQLNTPEAEQVKHIAQCYEAQALGESGQPDAGIAIVQRIIQNESSENSELFARAYNALGTCYLNKNDTKAALDAFLHTDVMFFTEEDAHAEALVHLYNLWSEFRKTDRAMRARERIKQRYRNTHWAAKIN